MTTLFYVMMEKPHKICIGVGNKYAYKQDQNFLKIEYFISNTLTISCRC